MAPTLVAPPQTPPKPKKRMAPTFVTSFANPPLASMAMTQGLATELEMLKHSKVLGKYFGGGKPKKKTTTIDELWKIVTEKKVVEEPATKKPSPSTKKSPAKTTKKYPPKKPTSTKKPSPTKPSPTKPTTAKKSPTKKPSLKKEACSIKYGQGGRRYVLDSNNKKVYIDKRPKSTK